jgi:predicted phage terminase large subunit-like protein
MGLSAGDLNRLMVLMPPGSAKSTYASVIFPAWWFTQHPRTSIIAASHSAGLAHHFSRRVKALVDLKHGYLGYNIQAGEASTFAWRTTTGGDYVALGVRGAIAGRRADLVIIDDPIKSQADADSPRVREHVWNWYRSDVIPRMKPGAKIVLIMTRWHPDDLGGQLLRHAEEGWRILRLPALAEERDPLGRSLGEPLWPDWESQAALFAKRTLLGDRAWSALYQQNPMDAGSRLFFVDRIAVREDFSAPNQGMGVRAWDLAATVHSGQNDPDWTVGLKLERDQMGRFVIEDVVRVRGTPNEIEELITQTASTDGRNVHISLPEDPGQAGKAQIAYLTRQLAGYHVSSSRESGTKVSRATPVASQIEAGNVLIQRAGWNMAFLDELRSFPFGTKDDQVDALSRAFAVLTDRGRAAVSCPMTFFNR